MYIKKIKICILLSTSFMLTACGGEPSERDIRGAVDRQLQSDIKSLEQMGGKQASEMTKGLLPEIMSLKKIGCKADGEKAYKCDVELETKQMGMLNKSATSVRLLHGSDGWIAAK